MESPVKKIDFSGNGNKSTTEEIKNDGARISAHTIKQEEEDEPLLRENPGRFVLFPIQYHEVGVTARRVTPLDCNVFETIYTY